MNWPLFLADVALAVASLASAVLMTWAHYAVRRR